MDDETNWQRQLLVGLGVLVAVGALIGGIVALISIKAADYAGIDGSSSTTSRETLSEPSDESPTTEDEPSGPSASSDNPSTPTQTTEEPPDRAITLVASPKSVSTFGRINLSGTYAGGAGIVLQVQRMEGGRWVDFPTSATVNGDTFATYVETGRSGPNKFRVKAIGDSMASNAVTVRVS